MKKVNELEQSYKKSQEEAKTKIKAEPNKWKRFWKWVAFLIVFPFKWIWFNLRDWRTAIIFVIVFLVLSSEVWLFYLLGIISWGSEFSKWCIGIASACWIFWLGPGTPFLPLCIAITAGIKALFNNAKGRGSK